jgi:hypothetical protein
VATVRKGFTKTRKNREYNRPGPKPNPHSNTNFILGERHIRVSLAIQDKLSREQCTWHTSKHGGLRKSYSRTTCCTGKMCLRDFRDQAGGSEELAGLVSVYRRYYHSLDFDKQRMWWSEHTDYTGYDVIADGGVLRRGNKYHTHWVENINMMRTRLAAVKNSDVLRPVPITAYQPVCQKFLLFLIAGNHNTKDQHELRKNAFTGLEAVAPEDLDCNIGNLRSPRSPTCDPEGIRQDKTASVRIWLEHQGSLSLMNPTDNYSVLPYRSCSETHAHYVYDQEEKLGKAWAASAFDAMLDSRRGLSTHKPRQHDAEEVNDAEEVMADSSDGEEVMADPDGEEGKENPDGQEDELMRCLGADPSQEEEDAAIAREKVHNAKIYRYGNRHCGKLRAERPEDNTVSSYSHFNRIWRSDEKLN